MPVTGSGPVVQSSGGISQPLNCEIPSAGGEADHLYLHHHHHHHHLHQQQQSHYYHHPHYQSSLLAVVGAAGALNSDDPLEQEHPGRMTTDLPEWDVDPTTTPSKGDISLMDTSHGMISPQQPQTVTVSQIVASAASSSSSQAESPQQELWWTEGLAMQAQQEYPGELGNDKK